MKWMTSLPYPDQAVDPLAWEEDGDLVGVVLRCQLSLAWGEVERIYVPQNSAVCCLGLRVVAAPDLVAVVTAHAPERLAGRPTPRRG